MTNKLPENNEEWKKKLDAETYRVTREKGTEAPFTGKYVDEKRKGMYVCSNCGEELFSSETKFDSGTGWPSFTEPANLKNIELKKDMSLGMERTEVLCRNCGAHLGHVFDDGPKQMPDGKSSSGQRFCINSCSLDLKESEGK